MTENKPKNKSKEEAPPRTNKPPHPSASSSRKPLSEKEAAARAEKAVKSEAPAPKSGSAAKDASGTPPQKPLEDKTLQAQARIEKAAPSAALHQGKSSSPKSSPLSAEKPLQNAAKKPKPQTKRALCFAVVASGGRQLQVQEGDVIQTSRMHSKKPKDKISLEALALQKGEEFLTGPFPPDAVQAVVTRHGAGKKILVFKKKRRKGISQNSRLSIALDRA